MLFERYNRHEQLRAELPDLQLRYLRPPGVTAPQQPRKLVGGRSGWLGAAGGAGRWCGARALSQDCHG